MSYIIQTIDINDKKYDILIGKNAWGNEQIIKMSHENDLWFHFDNLPGCHVILQCNNVEIPKRYIYQVASLLFQYKKSAPKNAKIIYTKIKNITLTNTPGTVLTKHTTILKLN